MKGQFRKLNFATSNYIFHKFFNWNEYDTCHQFLEYPVLRNLRLISKIDMEQNIQSITLEIYVSLRSPTPLLGLWLDKTVPFYYWQGKSEVSKNTATATVLSLFIWDKQPYTTKGMDREPTLYFSVIQDYPRIKLKNAK